jgi:hypothetical protein
MIEQAMENIPLDENLLSMSNKKYIQDPIQERKALAESMGQKLIIDDNEQ